MPYPLLTVSRKRTTLSQPHPGVEIGLRVSGHGHNTTISSIACRFFEVFRKEKVVKVGRKRYRSARIQYLTATFRKENYVSYHKGMHNEN